MFRMAIFATILGALTLAVPAAASPVSREAQDAPRSSDVSAQERRPRTRLRVTPGQRLLYRDCEFHLAQEWRPSGTVIVPRQRCWWVRG